MFLIEASTNVFMVPSNLCVGYNLQYMAPFGIPNTGFCTVFRYANFVFSGSGVIFGPEIQILVPGMCRLGRGPFWTKNGPPKKDGFPHEILPRGVSRGSVQGEWIVWYPGGLWAGQFPPKPYQKKNYPPYGPPLAQGPWGPGALGGPAGS